MFYHEPISIFLILLIITYKLTIPQRIILWGLFILIYNKSMIVIFLIIRLIVIGSLSTNKKNIKKIIENNYTNLFHFSHNFHLLPQEHTIIVANHPYSPLELVAFKMLPKKIAMVAGSFHILVKWMCDKNDYILFNVNKRKNFDDLKYKIKQKIKEMPILVFVEDLKSMGKNDGGRKISRLRSGIFYIAKDLGIPITPLVIDRIDESFGRVHEQSFRMRVGKTFTVTNPKIDVLQTYKFMKAQKKLMESYK